MTVVSLRAPPAPIYPDDCYIYLVTRPESADIPSLVPRLIRKMAFPLANRKAAGEVISFPRLNGINSSPYRPLQERARQGARRERNSNQSLPSSDYP